jgi:serine phosphatase RsbU (regulator of sigma subunit)
MDTNLILTSANLGLGGLVCLLGLVILRENPGQRLNQLVATMLFLGGFGAVLAGLTFASRQTATAATAGPDLLQSMSYVWEFYFPTMFLFACTFPEERAFTRLPKLFGGRIWTPGFAALVYAPHAFHFLLMLVITAWRPHLSIPDSGVLQYLAPLVQILGVVSGLFLLVHQALFSLVNLGFGLGSMALLFNSYRNTQVLRLRQQIGVITLGLGASLVCYSFATLVPRLFNLTVNANLQAGLTIAALTLGPGSIAYAVVRYKFLDAKLLARRGILYALASAMLVAVYLILVGRINRFLGTIPGLDPRVFEPVFLIVALALFQPAIAQLEVLLDRMFLRDPSDYRNVVRQLGRELQTTIELEALLSRTISTVSDALLLRRGHVVALTPHGPLVRCGAGEPPTVPQAEALGRMLPRVSSHQTSYRLADRVEGLTAEEQVLLVDDMKLTLLVPLRWRGDLVGALLLGPKVIGNYTPEDVQLMTSLAEQVSVSLQNALLLQDRIAVARFEEELNLARQIQRSLLLSEFPPIPNADVHAVYIPSRQVGGDFYDVVPAGDGSWFFAIADVSGKGVPAALLSSMLQASLRTQAPAGDSLPSMLRAINRLLYRSSVVNQFATFFLARMNGGTLELRFSNAGHNWPVVVRHGAKPQFLEKGGTVLGILEDIDFEESQIQLKPGDVVVLYTDGVSEAENGAGEMFTDARLREFVASLPRGLNAREIATRILGALQQFLGEAEPQDDVTLLVLRVLEPSRAETGDGAPVEAVTAV